jgi:hypothetical protein
VRSIPIGARLFAAALAVYCVCPPFTGYDSYYVVPTALSLIHHGTTAVDEFVPNAPEVSRYAVEKAGGHWRNAYPLAVPVLAAPLIAAVDLGTAAIAKVFPGAAARAPHPIIAAFLSHDLIGGRPLVELFCGAFIGATTVWVAWRICLLLLPARQAVWLTLLFAFGTTQWSIASRNLMQHGFSILLLTLAVYLAILARQRPRLIAWAAVPVALSFTVRPSNCIAVVVFSLYVAIHYRRELPRYLAFAAPVVVLFFGYNLLVLGRVLPHYFVTSPSRYPPLLGLAMNLVSPARGLLVYMPIVLFAVAGMWTAWRTRWLFPLSAYLAAIPIAHMFFIAPYWAGHCFGPRYFCDMTPFFLLFLIPAILWWTKAPPGGTRQAAAAVFVVLALWGVFVNLRGATSIAVNQWSAVPVSVDEAQWRVWDWNDPPFLRGLR